jgi:hypothetical protein
MAYSVVEEGLVCLVADVGRFMDFGAMVRCVLVDLGRGDWEIVLRGIGRRLCRWEEEGKGAGRRGVIVGGYQPVVYACDVEESLEG